jgi:phosphate/sulfate permease
VPPWSSKVPLRCRSVGPRCRAASTKFHSSVILARVSARYLGDWKRIVVTVGEKIGKSHLTYAQGASAELVAMGTIAGADMFGLAVSTAQVLSSGVA